MLATVVIPTYNEAMNLPSLTKEIMTLPIHRLIVLVVDDNSPDGTGLVAEELARQYPGRCFVMHRARKLGLGSAYIQGFSWALEQGADYIIQMDADFSHCPSYIPKFLESMNEYDAVVGSRYTGGGKLDEHWSRGRRLLSVWANAVWVRALLGVKTYDATAGFKCWRRTALEQIGMNRIRSVGYVFQVEMAYWAEKNGLFIKELPIHFEERRSGQSKMSFPIKWEAAWRVLELRFLGERRGWSHPGDPLFAEDATRVYPARPSRG